MPTTLLSFDSLMSSIGFSYLDMIAILVFFAAWSLHFWIVNHSPFSDRTISARMSVFRQLWMKNMVYRNPKMPDTLIQNTLQYGVLFFASTSILVIGALVAGLGASEKAVELLQHLPFSASTTRTVWEIKVLLLIFIFTFAFFKFAWSYRLFNYVLILIGAAPDTSTNAVRLHPDTIDAEDFAERAGRLHTLGARHFTTGLNSYFFALAASAWFLSPQAFIVATLWVSLVLYRRAFRSNFGQILSGMGGLDKHTGTD